MTASKWARWLWKDGMGRWHAIVEVSGDSTMLACGRKRRPPKVIAPRPGNEKCCPTCRELDDLRLKFSTRSEMDRRDKSDQPVTVPAEPVAVS